LALIRSLLPSSAPIVPSSRCRRQSMWLQLLQAWAAVSGALHGCRQTAWARTHTGRHGAEQLSWRFDLILGNNIILSCLVVAASFLFVRGGEGPENRGRRTAGLH
jgi:hypothetical protein